jgi:hypothetical protein
MSDYKGIKGFQVQTRTEDPTPYAQALANNPYAGVWGSGTSLPQNQRQFAGFGTQTAAIVAGGNTPTPKSGNSYTYDGASWSEVAELNTARFALGFSTNSPQSSGIVFGGQSPQVANAETWNGSGWTEVADLNTTRSKLGGAGISSTSALAYGGTTDPGNKNETETWNGSSWTEGNNLNTARFNFFRLGTATAALGAGGYDDSTYVANVESYNGTSWTETTDIPAAKGSGGGAGTTTDGIIFGGNSQFAGTLAWNGSTWTTVNSLGTGRSEGSQAGGPSGGNTALYVAGYTTTEVATTEEWAFGGLPPSTPAADYSDAIIGDFYYNSSEGKFKGSVSGISAGTWASGGTMNTARYRMFGGFSPHSEGLVAGGQAPVKANVENYNGTSWTEVADIPSALSDSGMIGVYTAGVLAGGEGSPGTTNEALHWNGSAWTEATNMPYVVERASGSGVQTAGLVTGGRDGSPKLATTLEYDGTNWTAGGSLPAAYYNITAQGPQTSTLAAGGADGSAGSSAAYTYNGSSWTAISSMNAARSEGGWATQGDGATRALIFSGGDPSDSRAKTEFWDGTSWTELNDLSTARSAGGSFGGINNSVYAGGSSPALSPTTTGVTEEWSASDFLNKLVTSS